jgi:hypothetical protein
MQYKFTYPRRTDWTTRWVEFMKDSKDLAEDLCLDWSELNCISWCCQWLEECTGHNPYDEYFSNVKGIKSAVRAIRSRGYDNLDQLIGSYLPEVPLSMAHTGDLVVVKTNWQDVNIDDSLKAVMPHAVALADPPFYFGVTLYGLAKGPLYEDGVKAFAVGRKA